MRDLTSGVVHQNVEAAKIVDRALNQAIAQLLVADVA